MFAELCGAMTVGRRGGDAGAEGRHVRQCRYCEVERGRREDGKRSLDLRYRPVGSLTNRTPTGSDTPGGGCFNLIYLIVHILETFECFKCTWF